jgi:hypothetical protein
MKNVNKLVVAQGRNGDSYVKFTRVVGLIG